MTSGRLSCRTDLSKGLAMSQAEDPIHLVEQLAEANEDFRAALLANPRQAIEQAFGVEMPHGWSAQVTVTDDGSVRIARA